MGVVVKSYRGMPTQAIAKFEADAGEMAGQGYAPVCQTWVEGSYGFGEFLLATVACLVVIGVFGYLYMLIVKPSGRLVVTYSNGRSHP